MNKELQNKLFKKYPKIFRQKDLPMTETCMCWGIETGDGWYKLIDIICGMLQFHIDNNDHPQIEATQVKEKFGTLRFYFTGGDDYLHGIIAMGEFMSCEICEYCGSNIKVSQTKGWISTLCERCLQKTKLRRVKNAFTAFLRKTMHG